MKNKKEKKNRREKRISQTQIIAEKQKNRKTIITKENKHKIMLNAFEDFKNGNFTIVELGKKYGISQSTMSRYISQQMNENKYGIYR